MNYDKQVEMEWKYGASHKNILGHINVTEMIQTAGHSQMDQNELSAVAAAAPLCLKSHNWDFSSTSSCICGCYVSYRRFPVHFFFARNQSQDQPLDSGGSTAWKWDVQASGHHHDRKTNEKKDAVFVFPKDPSVGSHSHGWCWQPLHDPGSSWTKLTEMGH